MISVKNLAGRIARTLFVTVPDEATQFFWLSLEPSFEFDDDPRWFRLLRRITWLLAWIAGISSFVLLPFAIYCIVARGALAIGFFCAYTSAVGSFGLIMALRGIEHDRRSRHLAVTPEELSDGAAVSLAGAQARPEAHRLNRIMD